MKKYTLETIKDTAVYRFNIAAVMAVYPGHARDFARELTIAANSYKGFTPEAERIVGAFSWRDTPQGYDAWEDLYTILSRFQNGGTNGR